MLRKWFALAIVLGLTGVAVANKESSIGTKAPEWKDLKAADGKSYSLADLKDKKAVVVCFTCNECPVAVAYEDRFNKFAKDYSGKGVAFVAINSNKGEKDSIEKMKEKAQDKSYAFPYLSDEGGVTGKAYGAKVTPHLFVLDQDRNIAYVGLFDDKWQKEADVTKTYVADAVDAILSGSKPEVSETKAQGCGIKY